MDRMMKVLKWILLILAMPAVGVLSLCVVAWALTPQGASLNVDMQRGHFIDMLLSIITVMLAILGIMVAIGALAIGMFSINFLNTAVKKSVDESIEKSSVAVADKVVKMSEEGKLDVAIERVLMRMSGGMPEVDPEEGDGQ